MSGSNFGGIASGVGSLIGAAGDIYSVLGPGPKQPKNYNKPFTGLIQTPGYNFGGGVLTRKNDDFLTGMRRIRDIYGGLRQEVLPGFGRLTEAGVNAIRQRAGEASGNLRAQLGRRNLLGASFAQDQQTRLDKEYQQAENEFRTQAWQQELMATNQLLEQEYGTLVAQASQELGELGQATAFLSGVQQTAQTQKSIEAALKQLQLLETIGPPPTQQPTQQPTAAPTAPAAPATPRPRPKSPSVWGGIK